VSARILVPLLLGACLATGVASAEEQKPPVMPEEQKPPPIPKHRVSYDFATGIRVNPIGVEAQFNELYRLRLYASDSIAFRENGIGFGVSHTVNPAVLRVGPIVELRPATFITLSSGFYHMAYTGLFNHVQSYAEVAEPHSDSDIADAGDLGRNTKAFGAEVVSRALLLLKLGPIALRNDFNVFYSKLDLPRGKTLFYSPRTDLLTANRGVSLTNDTDLAWVTDFGLVAGARFALGHVFYDEEELGPSDENPDTPTARVGPLAAYTFFDEPGSGFNKPTVIAVFNWYLAHRYRTGEDVTQALPYMLFAFRFEGDLFRE
jgi:hypothetical protein